MNRHRRPQDDTESDASPLARWSERKARSRIDDRNANDAEPREDVEPEGEAQSAGRGHHRDGKGDDDMPPVDSLDEHSDLSEFFSPGVSERLRTTALRKFFRLPAFNIVDGLDDYDDDFTSFEALGDIITADMKHRMEMDAKAREEAKGMETTTPAGDEQAADDSEEETETLNAEESAPQEDATAPARSEDGSAGGDEENKPDGGKEIV